MTLPELAAITGAITGPLGLAIALFSYFRDRPKLWVTLKVDWRVRNSSRHDPNEHYAIVTVSNIGRRPEYISMVALLYPDNDGSTFSDTYFNPNETSEGSQPRQYLAIQNSIPPLKEEWPGCFVVVRTSSGRQYRSSFISKRPASGKEFGLFRRLLLRLRSIHRNRWAFRRRFLE